MIEAYYIQKYFIKRINLNKTFIYCKNMSAEDEKKKRMNTFAKYSAISFQMLAAIGLLTFAGYKLDQYLASKTPVFTALFGVAGVIISLYQVVKQLNKNDKA